MKKRKPPPMSCPDKKKTLCEICGVMVNVKSMSMHVQGKRHRNKARAADQEQSSGQQARPIPGDLRPMPIVSTVPPGLAILFQDEHIVCLDKPANFLATPGMCSNDSLQGKSHDFLIRLIIVDCILWPARVQIQFPTATVKAVHRLDMETSGVMVMALDQQSVCDLGNQFRERSVKKTYEAVVSGDLVKDSSTDTSEGVKGLIELPMRPNKQRRPFQVRCFEAHLL
jgi:tRNA pseudouridine32 synthase/23S rRNA pseudouridine746 synthase